MLQKRSCRQYSHNALKIDTRLEKRPQTDVLISTVALPLALWYAAKHLKLSCVIQMASSPEFVRAIGSMRKLILIVVKAHAAGIAASGGIPEK
jgi:hypothetical protein